jgi:hypothetical protein
MRRSSFLPLAWAAALAGCGYIGPPKPPSLRIPEKIADLAAFQRAGALVIEFTVPAATTDGAVLRHIDEIDLRCGPAGPQWEQTARRIPVTAATPGRVHIETPSREWTGEDVELRVRAAGKPGRMSEWSNTVKMRVTPPLAQPVVKVEGVPEGVRLTWTPEEGAQYRVFRQGPLETKSSLLEAVQKPEYTDTRAEYGKTYRYSVEAFIPSGDTESRSEVSAVVSLTPEDRFPPAVPSGLTALAGISGIELSWNPDSEPDLRGYYVYRSTAGGPFARLDGIVNTPAYSDRTVESGKQYRYTVSAVDQVGNESARTAAVEITAP